MSATLILESFLFYLPLNLKKHLCQILSFSMFLPLLKSEPSLPFYICDSISERAAFSYSYLLPDRKCHHLFPPPPCLFVLLNSSLNQLLTCCQKAPLPHLLLSTSTTDVTCCISFRCMFVVYSVAFVYSAESRVNKLHFSRSTLQLHLVIYITFVLWNIYPFVLPKIKADKELVGHTYLV